MNHNIVTRELVQTGKKVHRCFDDYFNRVCDDPLKPSTGRILGYLSCHNEASSQELQDHFKLAKATVSEGLSFLEERGYITYEKSLDDAREKVIRLTEDGQVCAQAFQKICDDFDELVLRGLTMDEIRTLSKLLGKINEEVEGMNDGE